MIVMLAYCVAVREEARALLLTFEKEPFRYSIYILVLLQFLSAESKLKRKVNNEKIGKYCLTVVLLANSSSNVAKARHGRPNTCGRRIVSNRIWSILTEWQHHDRGGENSRYDSLLAIVSSHQRWYTF